MNKKYLFLHPRTHNNMKDFLEELSFSNLVEIVSYENNKPFENKNIKYFKLNNFRINPNKQLHFPSVFQLWNLLSKDKIVVLKSLNNFESLFGLIICKLKGISPIVFIQKINLPRNSFLCFFYTLIFKFLLSKAKIISITKIGFRESQKLASNVVFLPFGIRINEAVNKIFHKKTNLLLVSKIQKRKKVLDLIKVFKKLYLEDSNLCLNIASREIKDKGYYSQMNDFIKINNLENAVKIFINLSSGEMRELYLKSDLYLLVSFNEPAAFSHLEAMNFKIPVLLNKFNGTSDYIKDGKDGIIVKSKNFAEVYKSLNKILSMDLVEMGISAKDTLKKNHDVKLIVKKFEVIACER